MLPTFIIAGAGKSGSTSLWNYLKEHPEVSMARIKEPRFFTKVIGCDQGGGDEGPSRSGTFEKGFAWYESLFVDPANKKAFGEATMMYFFCEDAPELIKRYNPEVKLIFILRNPIDRMYSQYWQERKSGQNLPCFEDMMRKKHLRFQRYLRSSSYKKNLERYFQYFSQEQILILLFDDLVRDALRMIRSIYSFIGVRADFVPSNINRKYNIAGQPRSILIQKWIRAISNHSVKDQLPMPIFNILRFFKRHVRKYNIEPLPYQPLSKELRLELVNFFVDDIEFIEDLLKVSLPHWKHPDAGSSADQARQDGKQDKKIGTFRG